MKLVFSFIFLILSSIAFSQSDLLQAGPMNGYSGFREVLIWVQTTEPAEVKIGYFAEGEQEKFTEVVKTAKEDDLIAKLFPTEVEYGTTYQYKLYLNDVYVPRDYALEFQTQPLWQWRTDPPAFSFAIGSCAFINEAKDDRPNPYGAGYQIFNSIVAKDPDFMVWLGDNAYLRTPDFLTERGIRHRHRHVRGTAELQPMLGAMHHYAIWDDHDYGPNDADRSYVHKRIAEDVFNDYWGNLNTNAVGNGGVTSHFAWNDVEFFLLDNRYHRAPNGAKDENKDYFGKEQVDWLIDALTTSKASFKLVAGGGQIISNAAKYENYAAYPGEREYLLNRLAEEEIEGVLFLSGDRHHTEISRMVREDAYPLIDITCSPLTSGTHSPRDEGNTFQEEGKTFYERNFGIVEVSGEYGKRQLKLSIYDTDGNFIFDYTIDQGELRYATDATEE